MPILIDFNAVAIPEMYGRFGTDQLKIMEDTEETQNAIRECLISKLLLIFKKFGPEFGMPILCTDYKSWRKDFFPNYKHSRYKDRAASPVKWNVMFKIIYQVIREIQEYFPYEVLIVEGAEADDSIAVLTEYYYKNEYQDANDFGSGTPQPLLILSSDKDFGQLHKYPNVKQWSPVSKRFTTLTQTPAAFLREHIIEGDLTDGVPNFLSDDDALVSEGKVQVRVPHKRLFEYLTKAPEEFCADPETLRKFYRNQTLIDFDCIPDKVKANILTRHRDHIPKDKRKILTYITKYRLRSLLDRLPDF